jgi:hypothetical protein
LATTQTAAKKVIKGDSLISEIVAKLYTIENEIQKFNIGTLK